MEINTQVGLHNKFDIVLKSADTGEIRQTATAYNVVLNKYFTRLSLNSAWPGNVAICVGTGSGTPAVTDNDLFTFLALKATSRGNIVSVQNHKKYSTTYTSTFTETEANGLITEVGLSSGTNSSSRYVCTHAMLQNEHGQQTTINKTNTDVLIITATLFADITLPDWIKPFPLRSDGRFYLSVNFDDEPSVAFTSAPKLVRRVFMDPNVYYESSGNRGGWKFGLCKNCGPSQTLIDMRNTGGDNLDPGMRNTSQSEGTHLYCDTVLSSTWTASETYQFKTLCIDTVGLINFGNPNIYPYVDVERTQTADGIKTGFNFGIAELMDTVEVYIDDVLQSASSYTWNRKDYNCYQAYESCDGEYLTKVGTWHSGQNTSFGPYLKFSENSGTGTRPELSSDMGRVLTFRRAKYSGSSGTANIKYSVDGENWSTLTVSAGDHAIDPPIQARYFKDNWAFQGYSLYWGGIGQGTDQLVFNTAPPANSVVKIKSKSAYPLKDADWIIQSMSFDISFSRTN